MARLTRKVMTVFGQNSGFQQIAQFGSLAAGNPMFTTDPAVVQGLSNYLDGWFAAVLGNNSPAIEDMNALCFLFAYQLADIFQDGVPQWETNTVYYTGSLAQDGTGLVYMSVQNANQGNAQVSNPAWWKLVGGNIITAEGDIIVGDANANQSRLPIGGSATVLTSNGVTASWQPAAIPPGTVTQYASTITPSGWLMCFGTSNPVSSFINLWGNIGSSYGGDGGTTNGNTSLGVNQVTVLSTAGLSNGMFWLSQGLVSGNIVNAFTPGTTITNIIGSTVYLSTNALYNITSAVCMGANNFNLPQMQGYFARGVNNGTGNDPDAATRTALASGGNTGDNVGSYQADQNLSHTHNLFGSGPGSSASSIYVTQSNNPASNVDIVASGGNQANPRNVYFNYIIKT